jgi:class 3 adenylate cyclase
LFDDRDYPNSDEPQPEASTTTMESVLEKSTPNTSDYLVAFSTRSQSYCVGYVDIVNSTKISASLSADKLSRYYEIFLNSMSKIIGKFDGKVIKNIGDCLLYYFPNSVNSAMSKAQSTISEELASKKLPRISYRISSDFGSVILMNTSISSSVDLIGPPVNMCAKINHCAGDNEFVIGNDLRQVAKKFKSFEFEERQSCDVGFRYSYPVYRVTPSYR